MKFEVYCDESFPDLFTSKKRCSGYLLIGSLWLPADLRSEVKEKIQMFRRQNATWGEIKWTKISPSRIEFYCSLIDLFESYGQDMRFRCIAIDNQHFDIGLRQGDAELGFYKYYYQLLHHWILDCNEYAIFCDTKTNRDPKRFQVLQKCLNNTNLLSRVNNVQALPSSQLALMQLCDILLGAASSRLNQRLTSGSAKETLVKRLESRLEIDELAPTQKYEQKFNIFHIRMQGGW
ncbi:MAG: DUF3800 domain-containing protein [Gammaproteobacteria bacterium]|nr:DUF3800 domain-containing protein [Gammaproteobacteria bacterium]